MAVLWNSTTVLMCYLVLFAFGSSCSTKVKPATSAGKLLIQITREEFKKGSVQIVPYRGPYFYAIVFDAPTKWKRGKRNRKIVDCNLPKVIKGNVTKRTNGMLSVPWPKHCFLGVPTVDVLIKPIEACGDEKAVVKEIKASYVSKSSEILIIKIENYNEMCEKMFDLN